MPITANEIVNNHPIRIYDNGGKTIDRYSVLFMDTKRFTRATQKGDFEYDCLGMDDSPFSPGGFGQSCNAVPGRHLGKRIRFEELPPDCQKAVLQYLSE
jgi:hypothetical protein